MMIRMMIMLATFSAASAAVSVASLEVTADYELVHCSVAGVHVSIQLVALAYKHI